MLRYNNQENDNNLQQHVSSPGKTGTGYTTIKKQIVIVKNQH